MRALETVKTFPDYSDWLNAERLEHEDKEWLAHHTKERKAFAAFVNDALDRYDLDHIIEVGCGTAWLADFLKPYIVYIGVDANPGCVELARSRVKHSCSSIIQADFRDYVYRNPFCDLAVSIYVLKHFGLYEWDRVFRNFLSLGKYSAFSLQTTPGESYDDGTEYHHVWIGEEHLRRAIKDAGHVILRQTHTWDGEGGKKEFFIGTRRAT